MPETRGERVIKWIEKRCRVPEGKDVGKPLLLREWQKKAILKIYDNPHGTRTAIISFAKKNAKTTLAACLLLCHLMGPEARLNTQLPSTAQSKEQAAVIFELAAKIIRQNPVLDNAVIIRDHQKQVYCPEKGTLYRALSADATTAHGQSPAVAFHDELGQVRGPRSPLYTAIENAMGAHESPLSIIFSTQAPTDNDLLSRLIDDGLEGKDPKIVVILYMADDEVGPFSDEALLQANPAADDFLNMDELRDQAQKASRMPAMEAEYRNYTLNQRVEAVAPWISGQVWKSCAGEPGEMGAVYAGLDLSAVNDLTAFVMGSPVNGILNVKPVFWLPRIGIEERAKEDRVQYDVWAKDGLIRLTPGRSIQYKDVAVHIAGYFREYDIRKVGFDRQYFHHLRPWLVEAGLTEEFIDDRFEPFGQGWVSMTPALRVAEGMLLDGKVRHGMHPVLTNNMANARVEMDAKGNRTLSKKKSNGRIDGAVCFAMMAALAEKEMNQKKVLNVNPDKVFAEMSF